MKLTKCSIYLLDFLQSTNEEKFFEELAKLDNKLVPNKDAWKNVPISKWKRDEFTLTTIPSELSFCEKIKIVLIQYKNISSVVMLTIEGELSPQLLESIEAQDYKDNMDTLEKYQKELWKFWKEKITSTILIKNELVNLQPLAINHLKFDEDDYERFLHHVYDSEMIHDETPIEARPRPYEENFISKFASKYGANALGSMSALNITDQSLSIFSQNRAVYGHHGLDFTGLILFDVKKTEWKSEVSMPFAKILAFQHFLHWLMIREQKIIPWTDRLEKLSNTIRKFGSNISESEEQKIDTTLFEQKALFQIEYAAFMIEHREISAYARQQLASINNDNDWEGEHIIETEFIDPNSQNQGILKLFSTQTLDLVENLKGEYEVIKEQYKILGEELSGLVDFEISRSSLRLAKESEKTQKSMKRQGSVNILLSGAIISLTIIFSIFTIEEFYIENFDPQFSVNRPQLILVDPFQFQQYEYLIPIELSTMASHNYMYTVSVVEGSIEVQNFGHCFFKEKPKVSSSEPTVFFLGKNGADKEIEPTFRLNYEDTLPYFSPERLERAVLHSVGNIQFEILAQDLQDTEKFRTITVDAGLSMRIPSDFDSSQFCENRKSN